MIHRGLLLSFVALMFAGCSAEPQQLLHVDLRTDMVPVIEFQALRIELGGELGFRSDHIAEESADYLRGVRLNSIAVSPGETSLRVTLVRNGVVVVSQHVTVVMGAASQVVTVVISRDCRGVECPATGNPTFDSCLGGRCVDPRCSPETPEFCPAPDCTGDGDCAEGLPECAAPACSNGICLSQSNSDRCAEAEYCDGTLGCRPRPSDSDAGRDAGTDAIFDLGVRPDAGLIDIGPDATDLGPADAGPDATDAGPDAADAGPPPPPTTAIFPWNGRMTGTVHASAFTGVDHPLRPKFMWRPVAEMARYQVQLTRECSIADFRSCPFDAPELDELVSETTFRPAASLPVSMTAPVGDRYYWRVRSCNAGGACSTWTQVRYLDVGRDAGDYNGDGYADLVVGAPWQDSPVRNEGTVYVYEGRAGGVETTPSRIMPNPTGTELGLFGDRIAMVGDTNGDGFSDVLIGAHRQQAAFLYFGGEMGLSALPDLTLEGSVFSRFGAAVSGGDVNGDGYADLLIGAFTDRHPIVQEGSAFVFYGGPTGPGSMFDVRLDNVESERTGWFGQSVVNAGDINGDGFVDIVVGAGGLAIPEHDVGRAYVFLGGLSGPAEDPTAEILNPLPVRASRFGTFAAGIGDHNGDGYSDVTIATETDAFVFEGGPSGLNPSPRLRVGVPIDAPTDSIGSVAFGGDINGDGLMDMLLTGESGSYVVYGRSSGEGTPEFSALVTEDRSTASGVGDTTGDGWPDIAVGEEDYAGLDFDGRVRVFNGSSAGPTENSTHNGPSSPTMSTQFGGSVGAVSP